MDLLAHQEDLLDVLAGLGLHRVNVTTGKVELPAVVVGFPTQINYHAAVGSRMTAEQRITILVSTTKGRTAAAEDLLRYCSRTETLDLIGALESVEGTKVSRTGEARDVILGSGEGAVTALGVDLFLDLSRRGSNGQSTLS